MKSSTVSKMKPKTEPDSAKALSGILSNLFAARLKSQVYHWNFEGARFYGIHKVLEEVYEKFDDYVDDLAERIRTIGGRPISSFSEIMKLSEIKNQPSDKGMDPSKMNDDMVKSLQLLNEELKKGIKLSADADDPVSEGMLTDILASSEKFVWMIKSTQ